MTLSTYFAPTRITFGRNAEERTADEILKEGAEKVLIHYGSDRIEKNGLLTRITSTLEEHGIKYILLGGVVPNPRLSLVRKGIKTAREHNVDLILAVGGGSVIDSAKAIGYGINYKGDVWDFYSGKAKPASSFPVGCILTIAAAGSEMSDSSVITNDEMDNLKRGCNSDLCRLRFAILDPALTFTVPEYETKCSIVDIQMHTMERYFVKDFSLSLTDNLAIELLKTVRDAGRRVLINPEDYDARAALMWASSLSHNGLTAAGNSSRGDWTTHQLEHELSGKYDIAHGAGLSIIWPGWARYVLHAAPGRFASLGYGLWGIEKSGDTIKDGEKAIEKFEEFYRELSMPLKLKDINIRPTEDDIKELADKCSFYSTRTLGDIMKLTRDDMERIYRVAM